MVSLKHAGRRSTESGLRLLELWVDSSDFVGGLPNVLFRQVVVTRTQQAVCLLAKKKHFCDSRSPFSNLTQ